MGGGIRLYLYDKDACSWRAEFGGHSFITFRQQLRPESSHLSSYFYNSVGSAVTLLDKKVSVVALWELTKGIPPEGAWSHPLENKAVSVPEEKWQNSPSVDGQKTCVKEKHDPWCNSSECSKERQNRLEIQKLYTVFQCNKLMKGTDRADKYLSYYSDLRKTVKWPNVSAKLYILQWNCVCKTLQTRNNAKELPARGSKNPNKSSSEKWHLPEKQITPRGPKQDP